MGVHPSGDGAAWDALEAVDVDQPHGLDYRYSQHLAKAVRKRTNQEHSAFGDTTAGGIHKPGGSAVLGMEITDTAGDPTGLIVADGTYRGHGIAWAYDDASNSGTLWCATAAAGASTTGDWTLLKLHPNDQWGGGDVTWAGAHEFDASVDFTGPCAFDGSVIIGADATLEILGDLSVAGYALFDGSVVITADATLEVLGLLKVDGTATEFGEGVGIGLFYDPTTYAGGETSTLGNGLIIKTGVVTRAGNTTTVTFGTAFSNSVLSAQVTNIHGEDWEAPSVSALSITAISIYAEGTPTGYYWMVIGY